MQPRGGQAEQNVAGADGVTRDHTLALDGADDEPRQIVLAALVQAGHLGGLAANQRAAVVAAPARDPADYVAATAASSCPTAK